MATFYFSRVSLTMEDDYIKKMQYLYALLTLGKEIVYRKDNYKIINLLIRNVNGKSFLTGIMVKYQNERTEKTLSDQNQIQEVPLVNAVLSQIRFIYDANESLLIYEEDKSHIPKDSFGERLYSILQENAQSGNVDLKPIVITPITETYDVFLNRLKSIPVIKRLTINLQPSNPNNNHRWRKVDEKLKADNITHYTEIQKNRKPGESLKIDEETESKILMGEDGYGTARAEGLDQNGEKIYLSTKDSELQAKADIPNTDDLEEDIKNLQEKTQALKNKDGNVQN